MNKDKTQTEKFSSVIRMKLDSLEDYEEKCYELDYRDFYEFLQGCTSLWTCAEQDKRFLGTNNKYYLSAGRLDHAISLKIRRLKMSPEEVPIIPMIEYKLVPTGNIEYFDATLTTYQRKNRRYWNGEAGTIKLKQQKETNNKIRREKRLKEKQEREKNQ